MGPQAMPRRRAWTLGEWMLVVAATATWTRVGQMLWAYGWAGVILGSW
jgi:hypothetical protein